MADDALEGVQAYNARQDQSRRTQAYNALSAVYGPIAGDPDAALKLQQFGFHQQDDPLQVEHARLLNTELGNKNTQDEAMNPLLVQKQQLENTGAATSNAQATENLDFSRQDHPLTLDRSRLDNAGLATRNQGDVIANQTAELGLNTARAGQTQRALTGILSGLTDAANSGSDIGSAFDSALPTIKSFYPGADDNTLAHIRAQLVADPLGTINQLGTMLNTLQATPGSATYNAKSYAKPQTPADAVAAAGAMEFIAARTAAVPGSVDNAITLLNQFKGTLGTIREGMSHVPGTPEYNFMRLIDSIRGNLKLDDLRAMRATGLSLGRVNMSEFNASGDAVGNLDIGQDPNQILNVLTRVKATYNQVNANMATDIATLRSRGAHTVTGPAAAQPGGLSTTTASAFVQKAIPGAQIPEHGGYRTPDQNRRVNGTADSLHLRGQALDFVPPGNKWTQDDLNKFSARLDALHIPHTELFIEEKGDKHSTGYHIHWGWGNKNSTAGHQPNVNGPVPQANRDALSRKYGITQ